jgi:uncharacterized protein YjbJ (UPF0337 family)
MSRESLQGRWMKLSGMAKECWGKVIADETLRVRGERDRWMGQMQIESCALQASPIIDAKRAKRPHR